MATTNKTLNTRVQLKYDLYTNWTSANPVLLKGEIAIVEIPAASNAVANEPSLLFKVGDGSKAFNSLSWASATAADVYSWAKEANLTVAKEGTGNVVAGVVWDATLNGGKGGLKVTTASVATSEGLASLQETVSIINSDYLKGADKTELQAAIDLKLAKADFETFKTENSAAIEEAKKAGTDAAEALAAYKITNDAAVEAAQTQADVNKAAIEKLNGDATVEGSVDKKIADLDLANTYDAKGAAAQALTDANAHSDSLNTAMNERVAELESMFGDGEGTVEAQIEAAIAAEVTARDAAIKVETDRATAAEKAISDSIGTVTEGKTVVQMIADAQAAATYDDTEVRGLISDNAEAIEVLNGTGAGSVKKTVDDAINKFATDVTDDAVVNSYKELIDWVATHGSEAAEMAGEIDRLAAILAGIGNVDNGEKATVKAYVDDAIAALKIGDYATVAALNAAIERIAANESAIKTINETTIPAAQAAAEKVANDLNTAMDTRVKALEAIDHDAYKAYADQAEADANAYTDSLAANYATKEQGTLADSALQSVSVLGKTLSKDSNTLSVDDAKTALGLGSAAYENKDAFDAAGAADQALTDAKAHVAERETAIMAEVAKKVDKVEGSSLVADTEIAKLATVEQDAEKNIIEVIKVNGVALNVNAADRSVDISHNVDNLEQDTDTYITLFCGSATEVI